MSISEHLRASGWQVLGAPVAGASGRFDPLGVMVHHYAGSESPNSAQSEAHAARHSFDHSPICHLYLDVTGQVHTITDGRANHAGVGGPFGGWIAADEGNRRTIGIEVQNNGTHPLRDNAVQYAALVRLVVDLCDYLGCPPERVLGHKEYAPQRKIDPRDDMAQVRADIAAAVRPLPAPEGDNVFIATRNGHWYLVIPQGSDKPVGITLFGNDGNQGFPRLDFNNDASWEQAQARITFDHYEP